MKNNKTIFVFLCLAQVFSVYAQEKKDALLMYQQKRYEDSKTICLDEIAVNPNNMESYVVLSWALIAMERYADAENYAKKAYTNIRRDPRIVESLGEASFFLGKNEEALKYFSEYINLLPDGARIGSVYYYMGEIYLRLVKLSHADIAMRTALQFEPRNAKWWARLGYIRERASEWLLSYEAYEKSSSLNPSLADAIKGKERVAAKAGR